MTALVQSVVAAGKLRSEDEFVRFGTGNASFLAFDRWLIDNMEVVARSGDADWASAFARGRAHAFLFPTADSRSFLAGAIAPSADGAGRSFPFFVAASIATESADRRSPETLPLLLEQFWQDASHRVIAATTSGSFGAAPGALGAASFPSPAELEQAASSFDGWTQNLPLNDLAALLYGETPAAELLGAGVRGVLEAVGPRRAASGPRTRLSLRLPLGLAGGAAVCFWLAFVHRATRLVDFVPGFFWTHDGHWGQLLLHLGAPPKTTLVQLWLGAPPADDVYDAVEPLAGSGGTHDADVDRVLASGGSTVADLLGALGAT